MRRAAVRSDFRRRAVAPPAQPRTGHKRFPAPTKGWVSNVNYAVQRGDTAVRLENWFPARTGPKMRGGTAQVATIGSNPVLSLFAYTSTGSNKLFAADETSIFDITTPADPEVAPDADVTGQTAGYYSTTMVSTAGGDYLYAVNGADYARLFDGTDWWAITDESTYSLPYDAKTGAFTQGATVTGGTSGASATIIDVVDNGTDGILYVQGITSGPFQDNETITDGSGGSADADIPSGVTEVQSITIDDDGSSPFAATSDFSFVWSWKNRLMFIAGGSMNAYALPVEVLGGTLIDIPLTGLFSAGGALLMGATWSFDAGDGVDDYCVFITDRGQAAVYQGTDPSDATKWSLVGVYDLGPPLGMNAMMRAGGDLLVATEEGIVSLGAAMQKDPAALSIGAISSPIEPDWKAEAATRRTKPWNVLKWTEQNVAIVGMPVVSAATPAACLVVNVETGAWAKYTGLDTNCLARFGSAAYFGTTGGDVMQFESGGTDDGVNFTAVCVLAFDDLGSPGAFKEITFAQAQFITTKSFLPKLSGAVDYDVSLPSAPNSAANTATSEWDSALWDVAVWDGGLEKYRVSHRDAIGASGFAFAPQIQITSGTTNSQDAQLVTIDVWHQRGGLII